MKEKRKIAHHNDNGNSTGSLTPRGTKHVVQMFFRGYVENKIILVVSFFRAQIVAFHFFLFSSFSIKSAKK